MLISVDFRKSMHGFAMDSRTRAAEGGLQIGKSEILCTF